MTKFESIAKKLANIFLIDGCSAKVNRFFKKSTKKMTKAEQDYIAQLVLEMIKK